MEDANEEAEVGECVQLEYDVIEASSTTGNYAPDRIKENAPSDQCSRWQSESNQSPQYLLLRLRNLAILKTITFGKYEKAHVCNLRKFRVYGGIKPDNLTKLYSGGLKNDNVDETFSLRSKVSSKPSLTFPCKYVKIQPLQAWGSSFNFSIWFVRLNGDNQPDVVNKSLSTFLQYRDDQVRRMCMQFLRESGHASLSEELARESRLQLEHPIITQLYTSLTNGDFEAAERTLEKSTEMHMFDEYVAAQTYDLEWTELQSDELMPGKRGGHQMVYDEINDCIYLFGGWNGHNDLADLWSYSLADARWTCLSHNVQLEGGPAARSCHRLVFDPRSQQIFCLGRFLENVTRADSLSSDFFAYHVPTNSWQQVSSDTAACGGPSLTYDHQMVLDELDRTIYVFGGRILSQSPLNVSQLLANRGEMQEMARYSGLYSFHIPTNTWTKLREDSDTADQQSDLYIRGRCAHSMLFDKVDRRIYMFAGQRNKELLCDMLVYSVDDDHLYTMHDANRLPANVPRIGNTQRATINQDTREIYVLSGVSRVSAAPPPNLLSSSTTTTVRFSADFSRSDCGMRSSFWVFNLTEQSWTCTVLPSFGDQSGGDQSATRSMCASDTSSSVVSSAIVADQILAEANAPASHLAQLVNRADLLAAINERRQQIKAKSRQMVQPCPRYAHQLIYDTRRKMHYLFGGNPGTPPERLNDFWKLELSKCSVESIVADCRWQIRQAAFLVLLEAGDTVGALRYLQTRLAPIADECDAKEQLHTLTHRIFDDTSATSYAGGMTGEDLESTLVKQEALVRSLALHVYHECVRYFPASARPPDHSLTDFVQF